jgi:nitrite reductase (NADH) small subunit/3-phenylpropionate/trans-cinnamate dioxygenase ferredoxin subunit
MRQEYIAVAGTEEIPPGRCKVVRVSGIDLVVVNAGGRFYALDNCCPHAGGPLSEGDLDGGMLVCPWHEWSFNVASGIYAENPEIRVATFPTRVEGTQVFVALTPSS